MKRFFIGITLLFVLLVAYWVWPFFGLRSLAADIQAHDPAALSEDVDCVRLRRSLTEQIIAAYLQVTGRAKKLSPFENVVAIGIGNSIADPFVAQLVTPENLLVLLRGQAVPTDFGNVSFNVGELPSVALGSVWAAWLSSDYGIGRFSIGVPVSSPSAEQFRIRMELLQWRWKLTGVGLPDSLRNQFGQELAKKFPWFFWLRRCFTQLGGFSNALIRAPTSSACADRARSPWAEAAIRTSQDSADSGPPPARQPYRNF